MAQAVGLTKAAERKKKASAVSTVAAVAGEEYVTPSAVGAGAEDLGRQEQVRWDWSVPQPRTSDVHEFLIRTLDIAGSLAILLLMSPVMLVVALLLAVSSSGPILYRQERVGQGGKLFALCKFRTMVDGAERQTGPVWAARNDPRVTRLGRALRRTHLDELPQLFSVLTGHMSLVGPRPERPYFVRQYAALQGIRLAVKPGVTGLAQIRGCYDLKPRHKARYDYLYIRNRSLLLNLYILSRTVPVVFSTKGW